MDNVSSAAKSVLEERARQISGEGWGEEHDDEYIKGQLSDAACCYLMAAHKAQGNANSLMNTVFAYLWPWKADWWKPSGRRRNLIKAGALIIAELERMDRAEAKGK